MFRTIEIKDSSCQDKTHRSNTCRGSIDCTTRGTLLIALEDGVYYLEPLVMATESIHQDVKAGDRNTKSVYQDPKTGDQNKNPGYPDAKSMAMKIEMIFPNELPTQTRFNDGKCDPAGRFWVGTLDLSFKHQIGKVYRIDGDFTVHEMISPVVISNGIAWFPDKRRMYYIDTATNKVSAYYYNNANGFIQFDRCAITIPKDFGHPDGCTIDAEGMLRIALWEGHSITRWDPEKGTLLERIEVPALNVTSVAFGGTVMDTLYSTTAAINTPDTALYPHAGSLFSFKPGVQGIEQPQFQLPG